VPVAQVDQPSFSAWLDLSYDLVERKESLSYLKEASMRSLTRYAILSGMLLPALAPALTTINLAQGWNLVGNSDPDSIMVSPVLFGATQVNTVWKWNKAASKWAFFTPSLDSTSLAAYAAGKGYDVLTSIDSKEGFWVNAKVVTQISDPLSPPPVPGSSPSLAASDLVQGWNLMASADGKTPSQLNSALNTSLNVVSQGIATVWSWDAPTSKWRFYAPTLEAQGGSVLANYIAGKNYLPFVSVLNATDGFWVNIGVATPITTPPSPSAVLRALNFTSPNDWFVRINSSTAAQNTPAADGSTRYREMRTARTSGGATYSWTTGSQPKYGADLHWNGSSWANCPINFENSSSVSDANGNFTYNYCNSREVGTVLGTETTTLDVSSRPMIDVYNEIQAGGYTNLTIASAATALGAAVFPTGSKLTYRNSAANYSTTVIYYPGADSFVYLADPGVASGNSTACNANPQPSSSPTATLEGLVAVNKGTPCVYGVNTVVGANGVTLTSGARNESWGNTTLSMGNIGTAPTYASASSASSWYTTNTRLRVGFGVGNAVTYYSCQESWSGSARNCNSIGTGTYTIQTAGDGRTMTFNGLPTLFKSLTWNRVFIERGGHVFYGTQDIPAPYAQARFNLTSTNAILATLGLPAFNMDVPISLSVGSYSGSYSGTIAGGDSGTFSIIVDPSGLNNSCSGTSANVGPFTCTFSLVPTGTDGTNAVMTLGNTTTGTTFTGTINYYTGVVSGTWSNSASAGTFSGNRL
jgi:hypothetical protein